MVRNITYKRFKWYLKLEKKPPQQYLQKIQMILGTWKKGINDKNIAFGTLLTDLSKAFDC